MEYTLNSVSHSLTFFSFLSLFSIIFMQFMQSKTFFLLSLYQMVLMKWWKNIWRLGTLLYRHQTLRVPFTPLFLSTRLVRLHYIREIYGVQRPPTQWYLFSGYTRGPSSSWDEKRPDRPDQMKKSGSQVIKREWEWLLNHSRREDTKKQCKREFERAKLEMK